MEIGYPTDVKHLAHIGWDGPSGNAPTWMSELKTVPEFTTTSIGTLVLPSLLGLLKIVDGTACKAMGSLSWELYAEYRVTHNSLIEDIKWTCRSCCCSYTQMPRLRSDVSAKKLSECYNTKSQFMKGLESMHSLAQKCMQLKPISNRHKLMGLMIGILE